MATGVTLTEATAYGVEPDTGLTNPGKQYVLPKKAWIEFSDHDLIYVNDRLQLRMGSRIRILGDRGVAKVVETTQPLLVGSTSTARGGKPDSAGKPTKPSKDTTKK